MSAGGWDGCSSQGSGVQGAGSGRHDHNLYGKLLWKAVADTAALSLSLSPPASSHMLIGINNGLSRSSRAVGGGECWSGAVAVFGVGVWKYWAMLLPLFAFLNSIFLVVSFPFHIVRSSNNVNV